MSVGGTQLDDSDRLRIDVEVFRRVFDRAGEKYPRGKCTFDAGKDYLECKESEGECEIFVEEVMKEGLQAVAQALGYQP